MTSRKPIDELRETARALTRDALEGHDLPTELHDDLVLGERFDGDDVVFELYVPGETPADARILTIARLNAVTGEGTVEVYDPPRTQDELDAAPPETPKQDEHRPRS